MSHQAFDKLLEQLAARSLGMAGMVQQAVAIAVDAVLKLDVTAAKKVLQGEALIDAEDVEVERQAINLMLLHHPAAQDFRVVFGIVKINADLERIGDCAVNIAQQVPAIHYAMSKEMLDSRNDGDHPEVPRDMRLLAEAALKQMQDTVRCLSTRETALAEEICRSDDVVDALNSQIMRDLSAQMEQERQSVPASLGLILAAKNFERIGDHCCNIAEDIVYLMKGEIVRHAHDRA
ncbi:MAG TPA: phosphate signaling complex protein PhoU [Phycisphaerae bacterium]|jgi:phosphate transport system protein|nr:phosphate signaling complex protein PhoU [Phycisphaerae bacterium]